MTHDPDEKICAICHEFFDSIEIDDNGGICDECDDDKYMGGDAFEY